MRCNTSVRRLAARIAAAAIACAFHLAAAHADGGSAYAIHFDHWTDADERDFGEFVTAIGDSGCTTVDACLHGPWNPFRASDTPGMHFYSDCAQFPYVLRAYFAWKRGLPFSYERGVAARSGGDPRYSKDGNTVTGRTDVLTGSTSGYALLTVLQRAISTASYRVHPDIDAPVAPDFYSPAIDAKSIRPGTVIYDPNGHAAIVVHVESDGRIRFIDSHPDNTVTHEYYDLRFVRSLPGVGAGFKNWRPERLVGYSRGSDGALAGGHIVLASNSEIPDFSDEQYYGNGPRPDDAEWANGTFALNGETLDYYDFVRAKVAGGRLEFDPVKETAEMVDSNCDDLHYRAQAVDIAIAAGIRRRPEPDRLPENIYGTGGDWETYSTPSRDARLKTAFKELRDKVQRFVEMYERGDDAHLLYSGSDIVGDMIAAYDREAGKCSVGYARSDGVSVTLSYEDARKRLFLISFDPYQCIERRWGATDPSELASCTDGALKQEWYEAEQDLRNQIDRTYDARMDFSLADLQSPGPGKGVPTPPDTDARAYLVSMQGRVQKHERVASAGPAAMASDPASAPPDIGAWLSQRQARFADWQSTHGCPRASAGSSAFMPAAYSAGQTCVDSDAPRATGEIWDAPETPKMMVLPAGSTMMGSPPSEPGRKKNEGPQHRVTFARPFAVSKYLITFDEWDACVADGGCKGYTPGDEHWGRGNRPVINVNSSDAAAYAAWLSAKTGERYRLLSEAEWEYAARAGTETPYYFGDKITTDQVNYDGLDYPLNGVAGIYRATTTPVGTFPPNAFGLYDMSGNVWEWVADCWNEDYRAGRAPTDGAPWLSGDCNRRVVRAGAFNNSPEFARSAFRFWEVGDLRSALIGFRVERDM